MSKCICEEPAVDLGSSCLELCGKCGKIMHMTEQDLKIYEAVLKAVQSCCDKGSKEYQSLDEGLKRLKQFQN
jgi:hypothetical protein